SRRGSRWRGSSPFEEAGALVLRDDPVELRLLGPRVVEVVVDHVLAQRVARHLALLERADRLAERVREALHVGLVRVAREGRRELELVLDSVQPGREQRGECQVWGHVRAGYPGLGAQVLAVTHDAETACAVVMSPRQRRRRPRARGVALVGVDVRRDEYRELRHAGDLTREVVAEGVGLAVERVAAVLPETRMDVARAADPGVIGFGHERDRAALLVRHLLDAVLVDDVVVGHRQRVGEAEVDLLLARPRLALRALDADPRGLHALTHRADE